MKKQNAPQSNALFYLRHSRGLALKQVAKMLGTASTQVSAYEHGVTKPSLPVAIKLALVYNAELKDMFPDTVELCRTEIEATIKRRSFVFRYPERMKLLEIINSCSFEGKIKRNIPEDDKELVTAHIRTLARKLNSIL